MEQRHAVGQVDGYSLATTGRHSTFKQGQFLCSYTYCAVSRFYEGNARGLMRHLLQL